MHDSRINTLLALIFLVVFCGGVVFIITRAVERVELTNTQEQNSIIKDIEDL